MSKDSSIVPESLDENTRKKIRYLLYAIGVITASANIGPNFFESDDPLAWRWVYTVFNMGYNAVLGGYFSDIEELVKEFKRDGLASTITGGYQWKKGLKRWGTAISAGLAAKIYADLYKMMPFFDNSLGKYVIQPIYYLAYGPMNYNLIGKVFGMARSFVEDAAFYPRLWLSSEKAREKLILTAERKAAKEAILKEVERQFDCAIANLSDNDMGNLLQAKALKEKLSALNKIEIPKDFAKYQPVVHTGLSIPLNVLMQLSLYPLYYVSFDNSAPLTIITSFFAILANLGIGYLIVDGTVEPIARVLSTRKIPPAFLLNPRVALGAGSVVAGLSYFTTHGAVVLGRETMSRYLKGDQVAARRSIDANNISLTMLFNGFPAVEILLDSVITGAAEQDNKQAKLILCKKDSLGELEKMLATDVVALGSRIFEGTTNGLSTSVGDSESLALVSSSSSKKIALCLGQWTGTKENPLTILAEELPEQVTQAKEFSRDVARRRVGRWSLRLGPSFVLFFLLFMENFRNGLSESGIIGFLYGFFLLNQLVDVCMRPQTSPTSRAYSSCATFKNVVTDGLKTIAPAAAGVVTDLGVRGFVSTFLPDVDVDPDTIGDVAGLVAATMTQKGCQF